MNAMCGINSYIALSGLMGLVASPLRRAAPFVNISSPFRATQLLTDTPSHEVGIYTNTGCSPVKERSSETKPRSGVIKNHSKNKKYERQQHISHHQ